MSLAEKEKEEEAAGTVDVILEEREGVGGRKTCAHPPPDRPSAATRSLEGPGAAVTTESLLWFRSQLSFNAK